MSESMTFGSLFAGIGGIDLGFERAGLKCKWQVEIDDYATKVLEKHWPNVHRERDVRECGKHNLERVDIIAGGFPCQDVSNARTDVIQPGLDGERSGLWFEQRRIIREIRPQYVVVENVSTLLVRGIDRVLRDLAKLGYDAEWRVLSAEMFGAIHRRKRVFLVAYPPGDRFQGSFAKAVPRFSALSQFSHCRKTSDLLRATNIAKPVVARSSDGIPNVSHRLRGIGNAVVPQVAEFIANCILQKEQHEV